MKTYYLYMIECINGNIYTGQSTDFERRWQQHQQGHSSCKYTRSFPPKRLLLCIQFQCSRSEILKLEYAVKKLPKPQKLIFINDREKQDRLFGEVGLVRNDSPIFFTVQIPKG